MSEGVSILLSADDQASKEFTKVGNNLGAMSDQATQILAGMEETAKDLHAELAALAEQHKAGALSAEEYAAAQSSVLDLLAQNVSQTKAFNADLQKASSIVNAAKTTTEKYNEELVELARLHKSGALTADQFAKLEGSLKTKINETSEAFRKQQTDLAKVKSVLESIKTPIDRYNEELAELTRLQKAGLITSDQFAKAQANIGTKIQTTGNSFKDMGGKAKGATELFGTIANLAGGSELSGFAGQLAGLTEKTSQFSEVAKQGGAGALAFKGGLIAATAVISFGIGKAIGDIVFETKKWNDELENAKKKLVEIDQKTAKIQKMKFSDTRELITAEADPEARRKLIEAESAALTKQLAIQEQARDSAQKTLEAEKLAKEEHTNIYDTPAMIKEKIDAAQRLVDSSQATVDATREERDEYDKMIGAHAQQVEAIRATSAAKEKSKGFIESLKLEVEYLRATKEEQLALDAARNATPEMQDEALALLKERDALKAKAEAEKQAADEKKKQEQEEAKAVEDFIKQQKDKKKQVEDLIKSEQERIDLRKIELEQGKAAAKIEQLKRKGVDETTAQNLVAQDEEIKRREQQLDSGSSSKFGEATTNTASESRLLTRGPAQDNGVALLKTNQEMLAEMKEQRKEAAEERRRNQAKAKQVKLELVS